MDISSSAAGLAVAAIGVARAKERPRVGTVLGLGRFSSCVLFPVPIQTARLRAADVSSFGAADREGMGQTLEHLLAQGFATRTAIEPLHPICVRTSSWLGVASGRAHPG